MTARLDLEDAYLVTCEANVLQVLPEGLVLDRSVFYPQGGGQQGDRGVIESSGHSPLVVTNTVYSADRSNILHLIEGNADHLAAGDVVSARIDWPTRLARMRIHSALHLLSVVLPYPVTGGSVGDGEGRLDFDLPEAPERQEIEDKLNDLIARDAAITSRWITDAELDANPGLVKTMSVKPPRGSGRVRLVEIEGIDLQPCGGTHVVRTGEIGRVLVTGIEKKGKQNRRVRISLAGQPA